MTTYTYNYEFYPASYLSVLLKGEVKSVRTLVQRYNKWNKKYLQAVQSGRLSKQQKDRFYTLMDNLRRDIVETFAHDYPLEGYKESKDGYRYYTEDHLSSLTCGLLSRGERLVRRYNWWNAVFIKLSKSGKYSYDRLEKLRNKVSGICGIKANVIYHFAWEYALPGKVSIQLPASKKRWELEEQGRLATIRHQRWQEMVQDNIRCKEGMIATGEAMDEEFCPYCSRYLTPEEQNACGCACCGGTWYIEEGVWDEPIDY